MLRGGSRCWLRVARATHSFSRRSIKLFTGYRFFESATCSLKLDVHKMRKNLEEKLILEFSIRKRKKTMR